MAKRPLKDDVDALHFDSPEALRDWFDAHHATVRELWLLHYKAATGKRTMSWAQSVDEALAVGWIDSVIQPLDEHRYAQRFTPRKPGSTWSAINVKKAEALIAAGRMRPAGLAAFEARTAAKTGTYSYEQEVVAFSPAQQKALRANRKAWAFFTQRAPSYRRVATHWVTSAKRDETRASRLKMLIAHSAKGELLPQFRPRRGPSATQNGRPLGTNGS